MDADGTYQPEEIPRFLKLREFDSYKEIPIHYDKRIGPSKLSFFRSTYQFPVLIFRLTTDYYHRKIYFPISILITFFGVYSLVQDLFFRNITDITIVLLLSGLQVFLFGSIAERIARRKQYHMKWFLFDSFIIFIMVTYSLIRDIRSYNLGDTSVILLLGGLQTFLYALLSDTLSRT